MRAVQAEDICTGFDHLRDHLLFRHNPLIERSGKKIKFQRSKGNQSHKFCPDFSPWIVCIQSNGHTIIPEEFFHLPTKISGVLAPGCWTQTCHHLATTKKMSQDPLSLWREDILLGENLTYDSIWYSFSSINMENRLWCYHHHTCYTSESWWNYHTSSPKLAFVRRLESSISLEGGWIFWGSTWRCSKMVPRCL